MEEGAIVGAMFVFLFSMVPGAYNALVAHFGTRSDKKQAIAILRVSAVLGIVAAIYTYRMLMAD